MGGHRGAARWVLPTRRACEGRSDPVVPQRPVRCCSTRLSSVALGLQGSDGRSPPRGFSEAAARRQGWAGVRLLEGDVAHSGVQPRLVAGTVPLPVPSGTSPSCPQGEQQSRWRFPLDHSGGATRAVAMGSPDPVQRRALG